MIRTISEQDDTADSMLTGNAKLSPPQLLAMARGFACIFWGLLTTFILFFANAFLEIFNSVRIPGYVLGCFLVARGLFELHGAEHISRSWVIRSRIAMFFVFLTIYFAPFVVWWQAMPYISLLLFNCLGLVLAGMFSLFYINLLAAENGKCMNDNEAWMEAGMFAGAVVLLMIIPFSIMVGIPVASAVHRRTSLYFELWNLMNRVPAWVYAFIALPCALTLVASWKARERCYREFMAGN